MLEAWKTGHLHQKCTASQAERDAYQERKAAEHDGTSANIVEPEIYANALITEIFDGSALTAGDHSDQPKPWIIDSGCNSHFCPNKSEFITYTPFDSPRKIHPGNASLIPSLGEGTISVTCSANGIHIQCQIQMCNTCPTSLMACCHARFLVREVSVSSSRMEVVKSSMGMDQ